ncbi:transketolase, N-terminal subunit [Anaerocolumna cellulosilytica]|uniref:Transketolase, N-terminal subunit n=1 Tax=Anaerocolumna cellulosilytica TaxID=433286 RepID=A0A6S6R525_9FIRM|nr:transketolase [Anaerocolumna cellulosilytica]MBB5194879.1 transketolase [Anaerocolumna cellulosilytica]BCJ94158.1 transketolase, N-terminal subunit [Anaerocolumna cellulosilytica]
MKEENIFKIKKFAMSMRQIALEMSLNAGTDRVHFGGGISTIDILAALYGEVMKFRKENPTWEERDRFILSKGHGVLAYYAALSEAGIISKEELLTFKKNQSDLLGHPVINREKGIEFTTGSLGMGLSLGIGIALAFQKQKKNNKIYVLMGDGECNEGSVWEGFMSASQFQLDNITVIIDRNGYQQTGNTKDVMDVGDIALKLKSFGWETTEIDGHNVEQILSALKKKPIPNTPRAIIAKTVKGKGFSFSENNITWHDAVLTKEHYNIALEELNGD